MKLNLNLKEDGLTSEQILGFDSYKLFPKWVAPNVLTFAGFLFTVATVLMFTVLDYDFQASNSDNTKFSPLPNWTFTLAAFNIFMAYTLDGIDGKQARRTGNCGPLGELFDHGLDSYSAALIPVIIYALFGRNTRYSISAFQMYYVFWNILLSFYLPHWEKYNTGVLFLPWGYDISMWLIIILCLVTGIWGSTLWHFAIAGKITSGMIIEASSYLGNLCGLPITLWNIYTSYRDRTGHMRSFVEAVRPLVSLLLLLVVSTIWLIFSPTNVIERDPRAVYFLTGTIFSNISIRLIIAQMSNTRCELLNWLLLPMFVLVFLSLVIRSALVELGMMYSFCIVATIVHIRYAVVVVNQICTHLRINCFTIKNRAD